MSGSHPFLIVQQSNYPTLLARAAQSPWKEMKAQAISEANTLVYNTADTNRERAETMRDLMSVAALAYIVDPANRSTYKNKIVNNLAYWDNLRAELSSSTWEHMVLPGTAFFMSVLALDIIHDDLTATQLSAIEAILDEVSEWFWSPAATQTYVWPGLLPSVRGIWVLYKGDSTRVATAKSDYRSDILNGLTPSGVHKAGPGYGHARLTGDDRVAKSAFMDVLEFTREDNTYYSNSQIRTAFEWLASAVWSPPRTIISFADAGNSTDLSSPARWTAGSLRASRFSALADRNFAWQYQGGTFKGDLLAYVLTDQAPPTPDAPKSRIWMDMASFWEPNASPTSLMGALWNPRMTEWHGHMDVNAIFVSAYGENLVVNSGWALGTAYESFTRDEAVSSNTLLIGGTNHVQKYGSGIDEGFTAFLFDYASGNSGQALPNGTHRRNFVFVPPQNGKGGYFVLFDEATRSASSTATEANIAIHPFSTRYSSVTSLQEYTWTVRVLGTTDVLLTVFLGTAPTSVEVRDGYLSPRMCKYIYSTYKLSSGARNIVTVLFPHDATHPKASMTRVNRAGYSGALLDLGGSVTDVALESSRARKMTHRKISFRGVATLYRQLSSGLGFYFVRSGRFFNDGANSRQGFASGADVSVYVRGTTGKITSPGTDVTFYYPGITRVKVNGITVANLAAGSGWVKITVPEGTHDLEFFDVGRTEIPSAGIAMPALE